MTKNIRSLRLFNLLMSGSLDNDGLSAELRKDGYEDALNNLFKYRAWSSKLLSNPVAVDLIINNPIARNVALNTPFADTAMSIFLKSDSALNNIVGTDLYNTLVPIGVELDGSTWRNIDASGNPLSSTFNKDSHPCFRLIHDVEVDGQAMVQIPKFHFLYQQTGTGHRWWIAPDQFTIPGVGSSSVHKGFVYNGVEKPWFQIGAYESSQDPGDWYKNASIPGSDVRHNLNYPEMYSYSNNRGNGFSVVNIYQYGAFQILRLMDLVTGNIDVMAANILWRGMDLNGILSYCIGMCINSNQYYVWTDAGGGASVATNVYAPKNSSGNNTITDISSYWAGQGIFLPTTINGAQNFGTMTRRWNDSANMTVSYGNTFHWYLESTNITSEFLGSYNSRLSRVA